MRAGLAGLVAAALAAMPAAGAGAAGPQKAASPTAQARFEEIARFKSDLARQGVAVDAEHVYPVTDQGIAKLDKKSGKPIAEWKGPKDGPIIHLDSGVVIDGKLYASHSNYPQEPMTSSVEIWDVADHAARRHAQLRHHVGLVHLDRPARRLVVGGVRQLQPRVRPEPEAVRQHATGRRSSSSTTSGNGSRPGPSRPTCSSAPSR